MNQTRNIIHWRIGPSIDVFDLESPAELGVMHCHPTANIGVVVEGRATIDHGGRRYDQPQGSVVLLNPFEAHASAWHGERNRYFVINLAPEAWSSLCGAVGAGAAPLRLCGPISQDPILAHAMLGLRSALLAGDCPVGRADIAGLFETLSRRRALTVGDLPSARAVEEFRAWAISAEDEMAGAGGCRIADVAQGRGLSRFRFARIIREEAGMEPRRLRLQLMVATAQCDIASGLSLSNAALNAGFADQSHMNREFRRTLGMTPREYQKVTRNIL